MSPKLDSMPCTEALEEFLRSADKDDLLTGHIALQEIMEHFGFTPEMFVMKGIWYSASDIAMRLSMSPQKVGRIIKQLNIRDNYEHVRCVIVKVKPNKAVPTFYYDGYVLEMVRSYLS